MSTDLFHRSRPWESPELSGEGRLPMRSPLLPWPEAGAALAAAAAGPLGGLDETDPWRLSLDGTWRFALARNPDARPLDFSGPAFDDSAWTDLRVPGTWTLQGFDKPHYTNVIMPFGNVPPSAPARENPTGLYRVTFDLPEGWAGRRVVLHVGGAESFLEAWCNGTRLGFSKDTRLPSEFDLTPCLKSGRNLLAFMVVRYGDASFVEDQDQWWFGGIYRSVYLYSTAFAWLADVDARASLAPDQGSGSADIAVSLGFAFDPAGDQVPAMMAPVDYDGTGLPAGIDPVPLRGDWRVRVALHGPLPPLGESGVAASSPNPGPLVASAEAEVGARYRASRWEARFSLPVPAPQAWNHEDPALYALVVSLLSPQGEEVEHAACCLGFRTVEVRDRALLVNGQRVLIRGVNRHEHDERWGKTLDLAGMVRDIGLMKRHNFNAVRLSHYPNDERWYELCDRYGLYLVDEANIESHAYYDHLCRDPRWASAFLERGMRMVLRDKNHPSIILWSLGNESGYGPNHDALAGWIRSFDPGRPLHYEGASRPEWGQGPHDLESLKRGKAATDIVSTMYPPIDLLEAWATSSEDRRPFLMCEYSHAMGNSNGSLADYWAAIERHSGLQGGFIWDWVDQGIEAFDEEGRKYWKYGGDFGDSPSDLDFVCNGLVFPDRSPKPVLAECAKLFQPITARSSRPLSGRVRVRNGQYFTFLGRVALRWTLQVEGEAVLTGTIPLPAIAPGEEAELDLSSAWTAEALSRVAEGESFLFLEFLTSATTAWSAAGHRLGWEQMPLAAAGADRPKQRPVAVQGIPARLFSSGGLWTASGGGSTEAEPGAWRARFSEAGFLESLAGTHGELLASALVMNLWRAPTENDGLKLFIDRRGLADFEFYYKDKVMYRWIDEGLDRLSYTLSSMRAEPALPGLSIRHEVRTGAGLRAGRLVQEWRFGGSGPTCSFLFDLDAALPELPRIGLACALAAGLEEVNWYGLGPHECYSDRRAGAWMARHAASVDGLQVPYVLPQENGNRTGVRLVELGAAGGRSLRVASAGSFDFSASHHGVEQLWKARHSSELSRRPETFLTLDVAQRGVGTAACGPDTLEGYRLRPGVHRLELAFTPS